MNDISIIDYKESLKSVSTVFWTFLEEGKPLTAGCCSLREEKELVWAFLPPSAFFAPGERTGKFRLSTDQLLVGAGGHSRISMEDLAIALVDEVETPKHARVRLTVGY